MTQTLSGPDDDVALPVACCGDSRDDLPATSVYGESSESIIACSDDVQLTRPRMFVTFLPYSITMCPVAAACLGLSATTIGRDTQRRDANNDRYQRNTHQLD